jgi:hypothetical protein
MLKGQAFCLAGIGGKWGFLAAPPKDGYAWTRIGISASGSSDSAAGNRVPAGWQAPTRPAGDGVR